MEAGSAIVEQYARLPGVETLESVPNAAEWPPETEVSYSLVRDSQGQVLAWIETPVSESGDWFNEVVHHFGPDGRTVALERSSSFLNGCPQPAREHSLTFYGRSADVIEREYTLTDFDGGILDASLCEFL